LLFGKKESTKSKESSSKSESDKKSNKEEIIVESRESIVKLMKENPYSIDSLVAAYMIQVLTGYRKDEQGKYEEVLGLINELQNKKENISGTDRIRLNTANGIMYEVSSNISKLDTKIMEYNKQTESLNDLVKDNLQLHRPKYNLIFKKK
jgi:hypothetical protein